MLETPLLKHFPAEFHLQVEFQQGIKLVLQPNNGEGSKTRKFHRFL
jgi:hypothetical protein